MTEAPTTCGLEGVAVNDVVVGVPTVGTVSVPWKLSPNSPPGPENVAVSVPCASPQFVL